LTLKSHPSQGGDVGVEEGYWGGWGRAQLTPPPPRPPPQVMRDMGGLKSLVTIPQKGEFFSSAGLTSGSQPEVVSRK